MVIHRENAAAGRGLVERRSVDFEVGIGAAREGGRRVGGDAVEAAGLERHNRGRLAGAERIGAGFLDVG